MELTCVSPCWVGVGRADRSSHCRHGVIGRHRGQRRPVTPGQHGDSPEPAVLPLRTCPSLGPGRWCYAGSSVWSSCLASCWPRSGRMHRWATSLVVLTCICVPLGVGPLRVAQRPRQRGRTIARGPVARPGRCWLRRTSTARSPRRTVSPCPGRWPGSGRARGWRPSSSSRCSCSTSLTGGCRGDTGGWSPVGLVVTLAVFVVGTALSPHGYQPPWQGISHPQRPVLWRAAIVALPVFLALIAAAAASVVVRYRRGDPVQRRQLRWLAFAGLVVPPTLALSWLAEAFFGSSLPGEFDQELVALVVLLARRVRRGAGRRSRSPSSVTTSSTSTGPSWSPPPPDSSAPCSSVSSPLCQPLPVSWRPKRPPAWPCC